MHFRLRTCRSRPQAVLRQQVICRLMEQMRSSGQGASIEAICRQAADADDELLPAIVRLVSGLAMGTERAAPLVPAPSLAESASPTMTFREFAGAWTSNTLASQYRGRVRVVDHGENARRLEKHIYPIVFRSRTVGDTPLNEFSLDVADHVLAQPTLPSGSLRHVAQIMHRVMKLAVYPARLLTQSPFPPGWLPPANATRERGYLYPSEDAALMQLTDLPIVWRIFFGFSAREGLRRENAAALEWSNLSLEFAAGVGHLVLDKTKNGRGASWALDAGTTQALLRWRSICPPSRWVFPTEALPRFRRRRQGQSLHVDHAGEILRAALKEAGVTRAKLFEHGEHRLQLRAHDLRATFVTLALANGKTEDWVKQRTGHTSSVMLGRYRREAETASELGLGWLHPLHELIPELAAIKLG
jgi:integrase